MNPEGSQTVFRTPLAWHEIPLPPGYDSGMLDPERKRRAAEAHEAFKTETLATRAKVWARCQEDRGYRRKVLALCEVDPVFWINTFCWTYDDRVSTDEPMVLYPFQVEKIVKPYQMLCSTKGRTRYTQCTTKSRGVGWTWVELLLRLHSFLFRENWSVLVGSVTKQDVDDAGQEATHESLFGKIRYAISHLPRWMREETLGPLFDKEPFNHKYLLKNPYKPRNIIVGRHFSGMFGRSGRFSEVWGDEIAHAPEMKNADKALKQTTNRFGGGSTPLGKDTLHYQLMTNDMAVVRIWIHWSEHPELTVDWYNDQRQHMTDEDIASELDCSFEGSAGGRVLKEVSIATHFNVLGPDGEDLADYQVGLPLQVIIDPGISDAMALVWGQWDERTRDPLRGRVVDFVQTSGKAIDWCVPFITGEIPAETANTHEPWRHHYNAIELEIIERHRRWKAPVEVFGDAYGKTRNQETGHTAYEELAHYGIDVTPIQIEDNVRAIVHLQLVLRHVRFARRLLTQRNGPQETTPTMADVVTQWRYPRRRPGDYRPNTEPVKDQYDHGGDCLKMWAETIPLPDADAQPVGSGRVVAARGSDLVGGKQRWRRLR